MMRLARAFLLAIVLAAPFVALPRADAAADVDVDIDVFYDRLLPYGRWYAHPRWGRVWTPSGVEAGWRPYTNGRWVYTHDGWLWDSDYEWGWAPFHYGRWFYDDDFGWLWVPGRRWAPAWVTWRYGGGYVGWAPMPPDYDDDYDYHHFDYDRIRVAAPFWVFVEQPYFLSPRLRRVVLIPSRNATVYDRCRYRARPVWERDRWVNHGIDVVEIERATKVKVKPVKVREVRVPAAVDLGDGRDDVPVYRPVVRGKTKTTTETEARTLPARKEEVRKEDVSRTERVRQVRRSQIDERYEAEAEVLRAQQATERKRKGKAASELRRRHEAERQALEQERAREKRVFEHRAQSRSGAKAQTVGRPSTRTERATTQSHGPVQGKTKSPGTTATSRSTGRTEKTKDARAATGSQGMGGMDKAKQFGR